MHKPVSQEAVTSLHDLSAVDLIAGFRSRQFSPSEVLEDVLDRLCAKWHTKLSAKFLPQPLQEHLRLVIQYIDFIAQERDMLCRQIVSTL